MSITLDKNSSAEERQKKIIALNKKREAIRSEKKRRIIERTFGQVSFDPDKTALEIQKEMRDEWN